jgi:hypothetical protein
MTERRRLEAVELGAPRKRSHSTVSFPYTDLAASERLARLVADNGGVCTSEQLAAWLKHSTLNSGAYRNKVAAASLFGLIQSMRNRILLTEVGERILDEERARQARVDAFLAVPLYLRIFERHRAGRLPPAVGLEQEMVNAGVTRTQVRPARQVFLRSAEQAGFFEVSDHKLVLPRGCHLAGEPGEPEMKARQPEPEAQRRYPKLIEATLEQAPWNGSWSREEFEEWADLFVRAARIHFGFRSRRSEGSDPERTQ